MDVQEIKQRFGIIGNAPGLNRAVEVAVQVAPTDLSVLITGESGTGKESFPQIIHQFSARKHARYIAVNCGAIPEGTIDSELFGHEKGAFTGAVAERKGYFEEADGGTIFLDEIGELPLSTQVRLLRVLEAGEFIKVGSSKVQKTNVRMVAATNVNLPRAIEEGRFREDLYYRLNTVPIAVLPLRERKDDIHLLFRKFAGDFAEKYHMPPIRLDEQARSILENFRWPGNVRQLKNITDQISIVEHERLISADILKRYLPEYTDSQLPMLYRGTDEKNFGSEREILYQFLFDLKKNAFDLKKDMNDLKKLVFDLMRDGSHTPDFQSAHSGIIHDLYNNEEPPKPFPEQPVNKVHLTPVDIQDTEAVEEESLSIMDAERELIKKALMRHRGKRKLAAKELNISERTLYRKIKDYGLE
ncbi:MAG: sigma 54-interacting transcriptional regulator [Bacteroidales bacterium]|jgi:transcriptional regulator with PAS, ATPase and Fis domain|nr:sigma 54-interacting transcriptional regulator [Bacteroidales bacterium]